MLQHDPNPAGATLNCTTVGKAHSLSREMYSLADYSKLVIITGGKMQKIRCKQCNRLLAKANFKQLEIKCPRCKLFNKLECHEHRRNTNGGHHGKTQTIDKP